MGLYGSIKTKNRTFLTYGAPDWYIRSVDDEEWKLSGDKTYYGVGLPSGFKGYACIPFNSISRTNLERAQDSAMILNLKKSSIFFTKLQ